MQMYSRVSFFVVRTFKLTSKVSKNHKHLLNLLDRGRERWALLGIHWTVDTTGHSLDTTRHLLGTTGNSLGIQGALLGSGVKLGH